MQRRDTLPGPLPFPDPVDFSQCPLALFYKRATEKVQGEMKQERRERRARK